jgi:hypothetical protein
MESFIIKTELAQAILDYLTTKPYREVYVLIAGLQKLEKTQPEQKEEKVD